MATIYLWEGKPLLVDGKLATDQSCCCSSSSSSSSTYHENGNGEEEEDPPYDPEG